MNRSFKVMTIVAIFTAGIFMGCSGGGGGAVACIDFYVEDVARHFTIDKQDMSERVVFLGDSITASWDVDSVTPGSISFGIGGETTPQLASRIGKFNFTHTARGVVVAIGTNDIRRSIAIGDSEAAIRTVLDNISVPVIVSGIHPVGAPEPDNNAKIGQRNAMLESVCAEYQNCTFSPSPFASPLEAQYHTGDGLHLNAAGYSVWAPAVRDALTAAGVLP